MEPNMLLSAIPKIRNELMHPRYAEAIANKDAEELYRLLSAPGDSVAHDPIPIHLVRAALSTIAFAAELHPTSAIRDKWRAIVDRQTPLLVGVTEIPRRHAQPIANAAFADGLLPGDYKFGVSSPSRLEQLGISSAVRGWFDIHQAMGW
jgi:hypothetical protein